MPEISPVVVSRDRPAGSEGDTDHAVTVPPLEVGEAAVMAVPLVNVNELWEYVTVEGGTSFTSNVKVAVSLPPVLVAVTV